MEALIHLKESIEGFSTLQAGEWEVIASKWKVKGFDKGDFVIRPGQIERYFYFVHSGVLRAYMLNDGAEVSIGFSYDGDYSGAYDSFLEQQPTDWHLQAITPVESLRISYTDLMALFDRYKSMERWGRLFNAHILIGMSRRQLEVRNFSAEERFERLFTQSPHIFQLVPQKYLASYLGMTAETFSRMRKQRMAKY